MIKVRIPNSRVMAQNNHWQISEVHNRCYFKWKKSPTVNRKANLKEKKILHIDKMRNIYWQTTVLVEAYSIFTLSDLEILVNLYQSQTIFNFHIDMIVLRSSCNGRWAKGSNPAFTGIYWKSHLRILQNQYYPVYRFQCTRETPN